MIVRERLDPHAQLVEAAQIERKLSGPCSLQFRRMEIASEVFATREVFGNFAVLSQHARATLGDIGGKGSAAGMWFTNLAAEPEIMV